MDAIAKGIAEGIVKVLIGFPLTVGFIRLWVWGGAFEYFDLPAPTWTQTWGLSLLIITLA